MIIPRQEEKGFAMISALAFIAILAVIATVSIWVAGSEKKVSFSGETQQNSFYAADAGGEASINWIRTQTTPPGFIGTTKDVYQQSTYSDLDDDQQYRFDMTYIRKRPRPGWSIEYKDFDYRVITDGASVNNSQSQLELNLSRLFKEGY
jgi:Tfp pilus assembly protein PilX